MSFETDWRSAPGHGLAELTEVCLKQVLKIENLCFTSPWSAVELRCVLQDEGALCLGVWARRELIGYAIGYVEDADFHLASLAVDPAQRRRGWGGVLLQQLLEKARQKGGRVCTLEVRASNRIAQQLYQRHGFQPAGVRPYYYTRPMEHAQVMHKNIETSHLVSGEMPWPR